MEVAMASQVLKKWLLLIHQIPPKPDSLRVKIWRRLQRIGAVAIKQSVYVMPHSEQAREDLSWTLKEIIAGNGNGSISEARFVEGLDDKQISALFQNARKADYEKIVHDSNLLLNDWSSGKIDPRDPAVKGSAQVSKLQRRFDEIAAIDFFQTPGRGTADILIQKLAALLSGQAVNMNSVNGELDDLKGKTWVTRRNLFVDRIACGWLIRRFVDKAAPFKFVDATASYAPKTGEIRFDMFDGEYTHEGDQCTFEVMIQRFQLKDRGLLLLAQVIHDIDLKDTKYNRVETEGVNALLTGLAASHAVDDKRMAAGMPLFENLYAYFQRKKGN
jgi:hypothetical protein